MSQRNLDYLHRRRIVYRRNPINDTPTKKFNWGEFYREGTYECYTLFRTKAKITSYRSYKWHLLVLRYLNPDYKDFEGLAYFIANKKNGFVSINLYKSLINSILRDIDIIDISRPPKNKLRKVIFKDNSGLEIKEKLQIVGRLIGRTKKAKPDDIYETMLYLHEDNKKITISKIAKVLNVSTRTIYRNITKTIKKEKLMLNEEV